MNTKELDESEISLEDFLESALDTFYRTVASDGDGSLQELVALLVNDRQILDTKEGIDKIINIIRNSIDNAIMDCCKLKESH